MRINKEIILRQLGNDYIIVNPFLPTETEDNIFSLNETAAWLFQEMSKRESFTLEEMTQELMREYDIDEITAKRDLIDLTNQWIQLRMIFD